jgi:hypothetical protein
MLGDIDLIFGIWVYNDELQIKFTFRSGPMIFGQVMALGFCHHFLSLCLEILTWFLVYECIMMSYRSSLHFVPAQWFLALGLWNLAKYLVVTTIFSPWFEILTWFLVCECIVMSYRSSLNFVPIEWFWSNLRTLVF